MPPNDLKIQLKPSYRATAKKLGLDPDEVYENDPILFQQGYDITEMEIGPGRIFSISNNFEHGEIFFDEVRYILLDQNNDEFEDEFDEMNDDGLILKPGNYLFHSDGITIERNDKLNDDEDEFDDDEYDDDEKISPEERLIFDAIINSAKRRFNYAEFESEFSSFNDDIASNILLETITLLASGDTHALVSAKLFNNLLVMGISCDKNELDDFVKDKTKELKIEIYVINLAGQMLHNGTNPLAVLDFVRKMLN